MGSLKAGSRAIARLTTGEGLNDVDTALVETEAGKLRWWITSLTYVGSVVSSDCKILKDANCSSKSFRLFEVFHLQ